MRDGAPQVFDAYPRVFSRLQVILILTSEPAWTIVYAVELVYGAGRLDRCVARRR